MTHAAFARSDMLSRFMILKLTPTQTRYKLSTGKCQANNDCLASGLKPVLNDSRGSVLCPDGRRLASVQFGSIVIAERCCRQRFGLAGVLCRSPFRCRKSRSQSSSTYLRYLRPLYHRQFRLLRFRYSSTPRRYPKFSACDPE